MQPETFVVRDEDDLMTCRSAAAMLAAKTGFAEVDRVRITTAVSEIVRNALLYAGGGEMVLKCDGNCLTVVVRDNGPGIVDAKAALRDGYSTSNSLGIGLPGSKRLMDSLEVETNSGKGTTVTMKKSLK